MTEINLTPTEQKLLACAWQCFEGTPNVRDPGLGCALAIASFCLSILTRSHHFLDRLRETLQHHGPYKLPNHEEHDGHHPQEAERCRRCHYPLHREQPLPYQSRFVKQLTSQSPKKADGDTDASTPTKPKPKAKNNSKKRSADEMTPEESGDDETKTDGSPTPKKTSPKKASPKKRVKKEAVAVKAEEDADIA